MKAAGILVSSLAVWQLAFLSTVEAVTPPADQVLAEGTRLTLQLNDHLSTRLNNEGDSFSASVIVPVYLGERVVIPKGSLITGSIGRIQRPGRFRGKAVMSLVFQSIRIPGRGELPIVAALASMGGEGDAEVRSEGTLQAGSSAGRDAARVGTGAATGAGVGGLSGGGKGAGIGAGIGAAVGLATVFATRGKDVEVRRGASMDITLERPLTLPPDAGEPPASKIR